MRDGRSVCPVCPAGLPSRGQMYFRRWKVRLRSAVKGQPASRRGRSVPARARLPLRQGVMGTLHHRPHVEPNCRRTVTNRYGRYTWSRPVPNGPNGPGSSHFIPSGPERSRAPLTWIDDIGHKMRKNRPSVPGFLPLSWRHRQKFCLWRPQDHIFTYILVTAFCLLEHLLDHSQDFGF